MVRYTAKFLVHDGIAKYPKRRFIQQLLYNKGKKICGIGYPKEVQAGMKFWCHLCVDDEMVIDLCRLTYLGDDHFMQQSTWYEGMVELPYGEKFPPIGNEYESPLLLDKEYLFQYGNDIVGKCVLNSIIEVIKDDFDIRPDENGRI
jgi:hypothetical protein